MKLLERFLPGKLFPKTYNLFLPLTEGDLLVNFPRRKIRHVCHEVKLMKMKYKKKILLFNKLTSFLSLALIKDSCNGARLVVWETVSTNTK